MSSALADAPAAGAMGRTLASALEPVCAQRRPGSGALVHHHRARLPHSGASRPQRAARREPRACRLAGAARDCARAPRGAAHQPAGCRRHGLVREPPSVPVAFRHRWRSLNRAPRAPRRPPAAVGSNARERTANLVTSLPFIVMGARWAADSDAPSRERLFGALPSPRSSTVAWPLPPSARRRSAGASLVGVGAAAMAYHASWGATRRSLREVDHQSIAVSALARAHEPSPLEPRGAARAVGQANSLNSPSF